MPARWRRATTSASCRPSTARRRWRAASPIISRAERLAAFPNVDGVVALTHGSGCGMDTQGEGMQILRRTLGGYARHANFARRADHRARLRGEPDQRAARRGALTEGPLLRTFSIQDTGGTAKTIAHGIGMIEEMLPHANDVTREPVPASHITDRPAMRRIGRLFGHHGESRARRGGRPARPPRRHGDPVRDARDLRRRAPADAPRGVARRRREARVPHPLVGGVHDARARRDEQQPVARQQGRRPDDDPREVARRRREGRHDEPRRRLRIRASR